MRWPMVTYLRFSILLALSACHLAVYPCAQEITGTISGKVTDASGGTMPSVEITVTRADTGRSRTVGTDAEGNYLIEGLNLGTYTLTTALPGFAPYEQKGIVLEAPENGRKEINIELKIGLPPEGCPVIIIPPGFPIG